MNRVLEKSDSTVSILLRGFRGKARFSRTSADLKIDR